MFNKKGTSRLRTMPMKKHKKVFKKKPNPKKLRKLALAFTITLLAAFIYSQAYNYTQEAEYLRQLESTRTSLQESIEQHRDYKAETAQEQAEKEKEINELEKKLQEKEKELQAKRRRQAAYAAEQKEARAAEQERRERSVSVSYSGSKRDWLRQSNIPQSDWGNVEWIIGHENGLWCPTRWNGQPNCPDTYTPYNPTGGSSAYGICQALPGDKMASAGADWRTNPVTQLNWCHSYAQSRYGGWANAVSFWRANGWW